MGEPAAVAGDRSRTAVREAVSNYKNANEVEGTE